jgi:hypothetical protein
MEFTAFNWIDDDRYSKTHTNKSLKIADGKQ